jgi:release factor glutamine methyltransferase
MKLITAKQEFNEILKQSGVDDVSNNVTQLFLHALNLNRSELVLKTDLTNEEYNKVKRLVKKRAKHYPLQYIIKSVEFYGNTICVNKNVLIPRNETEQLCEMVAKNANGKKVLDLCTGSGCIGLGIKANSTANVTLADISKGALNVARKNAKLNGLKVKVVETDLFSNVKGKFDIIVSNPPYIKTKDLEKLQPEVKFEPELALDGMADGYYFYKKIINEAPKFLNKFGEIYFEVGVGQAKTVAKLLSKHFECIRIVKDYYNKERIVYAKLKG